MSQQHASPPSTTPTCPPWCTLIGSPLHQEWDLDTAGSRWICWHSGPSFGHVTVAGLEESAGAALVLGIWLDTEALEGTRRVDEVLVLVGALARDVEAAAAWCAQADRADAAGATAAGATVVRLAPRMQCPAWCSLAGSPLHRWEREIGNDEWTCWHAGPVFGPHVTCDGLQHEDGRLEPRVSVEGVETDQAAELEVLASDVRAAARWLARTEVAR